MKRLPLVICFLLIPYFGCCNEVNSKSCLPAALIYNKGPIPDIVLQDFLSWAIIGFGEPELELDIPKTLKEKMEQEKNKPEEDWSSEVIFEWQFIGTVNSEFHIVRVYRWEMGCLGKFTGFVILKREKDLLKIADIIYGGDRHSSMIHEDGIVLDGNKLKYSQGVTTYGFIDKALDLYPELADDFDKSSKKMLCYGEAGAFGCFEYEAEITPDGKVKEVKFLTYIPCEGCEEKEIFKEGGLKAVAKYLLADQEEVVREANAHE
jgi:hypothetical protein